MAVSERLGVVDMEIKRLVQIPGGLVCRKNNVLGRIQILLAW